VVLGNLTYFKIVFNPGTHFKEVSNFETYDVTVSRTCREGEEGRYKLLLQVTLPCFIS
jgi:hypothetical protein